MEVLASQSSGPNSHSDEVQAHEQLDKKLKVPFEIGASSLHRGGVGPYSAEPDYDS